MSVQVTPHGLVVTFPQPNPPASVNATNARGWRNRHRLMTPWKLAVASELRSHVLAGRFVVDLPVTVTVALTFSEYRPRDPHNYTGSVVKAIVDGIAGKLGTGLVKDDTPEFVRVAEPILGISPKLTVGDSNYVQMAGPIWMPGVPRLLAKALFAEIRPQGTTPICTVLVSGVHERIPTQPDPAA